MGGGFPPTVKYHYFHSFLTYLVRRKASVGVSALRRDGILEPSDKGCRRPVGRGTARAWPAFGRCCRVRRPTAQNVLSDNIFPSVIRSKDTTRRGV